MKVKYIFWALIMIFALGMTQSCGVFKKGCDCPSPHSGKRR
jgi:hypothetical protein